MAYPTIDELSIIFTLPFDKNFNLLVDSKFIDYLIIDDFFKKLNLCKAIETVTENRVFSEYYKNFDRKIKNINLSFDFKSNIWVYEIRGITLTNNGEDGIIENSECCYGKTIYINALTYEIINIKDQFYFIQWTPL